MGRRIVETLEQDEYALRAKRIEIPASITGLPFYRKLGYDFKNGNDQLDDEMMYRWILESGFTPVLILTKADKLSRNERAKQKAVIRKAFPEASVLIAFSSMTKEGVEEVLAVVEEMI